MRNFDPILHILKTLLYFEFVKGISYGFKSLSCSITYFLVVYILVQWEKHLSISVRNKQILFEWLCFIFIDMNYHCKQICRYDAVLIFLHSNCLVRWCQWLGNVSYKVVFRLFLIFFQKSQINYCCTGKFVSDAVTPFGGRETFTFSLICDCLFLLAHQPVKNYSADPASLFTPIRTYFGSLHFV